MNWLIEARFCRCLMPEVRFGILYIEKSEGNAVNGGTVVVNPVRGRLGVFFMVLADLGILYGSYGLAFLLRFTNDIPQVNLEPFLDVAPWLGLAALLVFYLFDLYTRIERKDIHRFIYTTGLAVGLLTLFLVVMSFWIRGFSMPRSVILLGAVIQALLMCLLRALVWYILLKKGGKKRVLLTGKRLEDAMPVAEKFLQHSPGWFHLESFVPVHERRELVSRMKDVDIVLLSPDLTKEEKGEILSYAFKFRKEALIVPDLYELFMAGADTQQVDDMLVFSVLPPTLSKEQRLLKRTMDVVLAAVMLVLASPIMLLLAVLIPLTSRGPAIYRQERLGLNGKPFMLYKFRSMVQDAEKMTGPVLAAENDPRITPLGRWMRATRLDELPQLFNVLKGDMSLVGPRPERAFFVEQLKEEFPEYTYRMMVKPGITGLAQLMAKYTTTAQDKLRYDLMYIRNYSIVLDLKILFQTILVVLTREQAEGVRARSKDQDRLLRELLKGQSEMAVSREK